MSIAVAFRGTLNRIVWCLAVHAFSAGGHYLRSLYRPGACAESRRPKPIRSPTPSAVTIWLRPSIIASDRSLFASVHIDLPRLRLLRREDRHDCGRYTTVRCPAPALRTLRSPNHRPKNAALACFETSESTRNGIEFEGGCCKEISSGPDGWQQADPHLRQDLTSARYTPRHKGLAPPEDPSVINNVQYQCRRSVV